MKSSEQDGKGGEGRGLPAGFAWEGADDGPRHLFGTVAGERIAIATAFPNGGWRAGVSSRHNVAQPRPGETLLAAAQAAAEAALWRCDGYGTGEVRGLVLSDDWLDHIATILDLPTVLPVALPGLPGMWKLTRLTSAQPITVDAVRVDPEGGVEVDAVSAPSAGDLCPACGALLPSTGIGCESCAWTGEPLPGDAVRAPVPADKAARAWASISQIGDDGSHPADAGHAPAEPAPSREPSAPADGGELARLLRGPDGARLDDDIATVRNHAPEIWSGTREHVLRVARACALLLAERERMAARVLAMTEDRAEAAERHVERAMKDGATAVAGWTKTGKDLEAARARIAELTSTPPPGTVAALLARVEEARRKAGTLADEEEGRAVMDRSIISYDRGRARGLQDAARFVREWASAEPAADGATIAEARRDERRLCIADMRGEIDGAAERAYMERVGARINRRATLTPSPLDAVAAEVCAVEFVDVRKGPFGPEIDALNAIADLVMKSGGSGSPREWLRKICSVGLRALACDAAKGGA